MKPLLTVVVPVYNVERCLKRCVKVFLPKNGRTMRFYLLMTGVRIILLKSVMTILELMTFISVILQRKWWTFLETGTQVFPMQRRRYVYFPDSDDWIELDTFIALAEALESQRVDIDSFSNREFVKSERRCYRFGTKK